MSSMTQDAERYGNRARHSDWLAWVTRLGLVAYGIVHVMVAWIALQLALGKHSGNASSQGAVHKLAHEPFGHVLVWVVAIGMAALVVWQGLEAALGHRDEDGFTRVRKRVTSAGKAVVYAAIGLSAVRVATGSSSSSNKNGTQSWTAKLMDLPAGQVLVALVGLGIIGVGAYLVHRGWSEGFVKQLDAEGRSGQSGKAFVWLGKAGYTAKGVALGVVGILFVYAAASHKAKKSGGLDQALHKVLAQPFGPLLLGVIAVGIGCYGLFCFARARHFSGR
jgi:hypothetical protein